MILKILLATALFSSIIFLDLILFFPAFVIILFILNSIEKDLKTKYREHGVSYTRRQCQSDMVLKKIIRLLEDIVNAPDDPSQAIDSFLNAYWMNRDDKIHFRGEIWREIRHLAFELENYEPNPEIRKYGFSGPERAKMVTRRTLSLIKYQPASNPTADTARQDRRH